MAKKGKNKLTLQFPAFEEYAERLDRLGGDLKATTEKALQNSHDFVTPKLHAAMRKHRQTGATESTILDSAKVEWEGTVASIDVGFDIANGGLPSIFLMYGTPRRKPKPQKADTELFEALYGKQTQKQIKELQEKTFARAIKKAMEG